MTDTSSSGQEATMRGAAVLAIVIGVCVSACGGGGSPSPTSPASGTKIINVAGNGAFGNVTLGSSASTAITVSNSGGSALTMTGINAVGGTGTAGFAASPTSGSIAPGGSLVVTVTFTPTLAQFYGTQFNVQSDATGGNPAINLSGTGINTAPIFTASGAGDNVVPLPSYVAKIRIDATYGGSCQNFVVHHSASAISLVNIIIGTCSVADTRSPFSGTYALASPGGTITITGSTGINWTITELR